MTQEMRDGGIIEPSESPWVSPVVMAPKKDGSLRFCVDYWPLNDKTVKDSLDYLTGSAWFSSLDLQSGYWQVAMAPEDKSLGEVLEPIRRAGLKLHLRRCSFLRQDVFFSGHRISGAGIMMETDKVAAVRD